MKNTNVMSWLVIGLMALGCSQTIIVFKPSKNIDPMPMTDSEIQEQKEKPGIDPLNKDQWGMEKIGINKQESEKNTDLMGNYNVKVAILSTGIDYNHKDLLGQVSVNKNEITKEGLADKDSIDGKDNDMDGLIDNIVGFDVVDNDGLAFDRHGAGTAVAGIIAARSNNSMGISGIMKEVSLYPIRYINENGQTNLANLLKALEITAMVKPDVVFVQQLQFQLGGRDAEPGQVQAELSLLKTRLDKLKELKIPVVVGAGEDIEAFGTSEIDKIIRDYDNIIIVSSSDKDDQLAFIAKHSFTSVHTVAPGENIVTTLPNNKYGEVNGTAYAAAHVTAALALAKAKHAEKKSLQDLVSTLLSDKGSDYVRGLDRYSRGGNRLNVVKYLSSLGK